MRTIILASHGDFSRGLLDSVRMVVGPLADSVEVYSLYHGASAEDFAAELDPRISADRDTEYVIIADIFGASVCTAMMKLTGYEHVKLFTGMSFNMVLELLTVYQKPLSDEDIEQLLACSRAGIMHIKADLGAKEEDF